MRVISLDEEDFGPSRATQDAASGDIEMDIYEAAHISRSWSRSRRPAEVRQRPVVSAFTMLGKQIDSTVAAGASEGQFENPRVPELVLGAIAAAEASSASHSTPPPDELWRRLQRLRELANS